MSKRNLQTKTGKWKVKELKVRWYCRNCHQKGTAGISVVGKFRPTLEELYKMIRVTCHTYCTEPDIRLVQ